MTISWFFQILTCSAINFELTAHSYRHSFMLATCRISLGTYSISVRADVCYLNVVRNLIFTCDHFVITSHSLPDGKNARIKGWDSLRSLIPKAWLPCDSTPKARLPRDSMLMHAPNWKLRSYRVQIIGLWLDRMRSSCKLKQMEVRETV